MRLLVIGAVNVDLVVAAPILPGPGETVVGPGMAQHGGGKGANAAVAAARHGADVRLCAAVGSDELGSWALADLRAEGIEVSDVAVLDGAPTGVALIVVDAAGENQIAVGAGANAALTPETAVAAVSRAAGWADLVLVSTEIPVPAVVAALEAAHRAGIRCVLNPAPVVPGLAGALALSPLLTPNRTELADLHRAVAGDASDQVAPMAEALAARTSAPVVVTLGAEGVLVVEPGAEPLLVPAPKVEVVDSTGAGDAFNGVLAACLAAGRPLRAAAALGVAAASASVTVAGARGVGRLRPRH